MLSPDTLIYLKILVKSDSRTIIIIQILDGVLGRYRPCQTNTTALVQYQRVATGKNEKEYSWHVPAMKFIGMKQLVKKVAKILDKLRYLWKCEIWGNIVKIWYFVNNCLIKAWILKILLHTCDTYNYDYLKCNTFRFNFIDFQLYIDFPFQFCVFYRKIT